MVSFTSLKFFLEVNRRKTNKKVCGRDEHSMSLWIKMKKENEISLPIYIKKEIYQNGWDMKMGNVVKFSGTKE